MNEIVIYLNYFKIKIVKDKPRLKKEGGGEYMTKQEIKELREMGYESEEEFIEEILGCDENYSLDDFMDSYDPD